MTAPEMRPSGPPEVVARMFAAFAADDLDGCAALFSEDAEVVPVTVPLALRGRAGVREALRTYRRQGRQVTFRIDETTPEGDKVLVVGLMIEDTTAGPVEIPVAFVYRVDGDQIVEMRGFYTRRHALEHMALPGG